MREEEEACKNCNGTGTDFDTYVKCPYCNGTGKEAPP